MTDRIIRNRFLTNIEDTFKFNAWDDIEWTVEQEAEAEQVVAVNSQIIKNANEIEMFDSNADQYWDKFYEKHREKFFKDRNWLFSEFPELDLNDKCTNRTRINILEIGCGVGNTTIPILERNKNCTNYFVYSCDFSRKAIEILTNHGSYDPQKCLAYVCDIGAIPWPGDYFASQTIDFATIIFVLSAIKPLKIPAILKQLHSFMKPDGIVLFRDYGRYDLAQLRLKCGSCIGENFYVRGDGTQVHFFTKDEIFELFRNAGFEPVGEILIDRRLQVNRVKSLKMYRIWMQAKFRKI